MKNKKTAGQNDNTPLDARRVSAVSDAKKAKSHSICGQIAGILIRAHGSVVFAFCMHLLSLKRHEPQRQPQTSRIRYTAPGR